MGTIRKVSASRVIPVPRQVIFDLIANPGRHAEFDGSGTVLGEVRGPDRLSLGATFAMSMKRGASYKTVNTVSTFDEGTAIAWHHPAHFIWRYDLADVEGGTLVTESFDYSKWWGLFIIPLGWPEQNRVAMEKTLVRIEELLSASR
jgi:hypothetical protein